MQEAVHLILPAHEAARARPRARESINGFLRRVQWNTERLPTICVLNGEPLMRASWGRRLRRRDQLVVLSRPRGGGGSAQSKQIIGLVSLIALSALAPGVGTAIGLATGLSGLSSVFGAAFLAGASFLVNTLISPKAGGQDEDTGQIYTFGQQSNSARVLQTIPTSYGRIKKYPDYAAVPWSEFIGNEQYLNVLLVDGLGKYSREQILVDDTILWDNINGVNPEFSGVSIDFYEPGEEITLFPLNVSTSIEVSGQELPDNYEWVGGYIANAAGTTATAIAVDFVATAMYATYKGAIAPTFVPIVVQYRPVDDVGAPAGDWGALIAAPLAGASKKPIRWTLKADVAPGRYEVRVARLTNASTEADVADAVAWYGLRAFLTGPASFPVSTTAIRMRATQQLTNAAAQKISTISTRVLEIWDADKGEWVEQATRSPAWAMWDIATNTDYGARRSPSKVDLQAILALDAKCATRGDCFDYEFSSAVAVPEALDTALSVCRAKHRWAGDVLTLVRDEWRDVPGMMLTDREIVRGSLAIEYQLAAADASDAVIIEYIDETVWQPSEVQYPAGYEAAYPARLQLPGIVQRAQAFREAGFLHRQNVYRRVRPTLDTEHDGRLISMGDHVLVQSDIPGAWGSSGAVVSTAGNVLTLEPAPDWAESGQHYVVLRTKTGEAFGPVICRQGISAAQCVLDAEDLAGVESGQGITLAEALARRDGADLPSYSHGLGTAWQRRCIAMSGAMDGDRVSLQLVVDDERVHEEDGSADDLPALPALSLPKAPVVAGLVAVLEQGVFEPTLSASWWPAAGALYYVAQVSYDEGESWATLAETRDPGASWIVEARGMTLRVAAVGSSQGPWSSYPLEAPTISYDTVVVDAKNFTAGLNDLVISRTAAFQQEMTEAISRLSLIVADIDASGEINRADQARALAVQIGAASAKFREEISLAVGPDSAIVQQITELEAQVSNVEAGLTIRGVVAASVPDGALAAYEIEATAQAARSGLKIVAYDDGEGGARGEVLVEGDRFSVATADGKTALFVVDGITGQAYLNVDLVSNGSIQASKMAVASLSAIVADLGEVIAGILRSRDSKFYINLNDGYMLISD